MQGQRKPVNIFFRRMVDRGFADVTEFVRYTKIDLSFETCRRAIYEDRPNIRYEYVVRLMQALEFTPQEIAEELKRRGDQHLHRLVAESTEGTTLSSEEKMLIERLRAANNPRMYAAVIAIIDLQSPAKEAPDDPVARTATTNEHTEGT